MDTFVVIGVIAALVLVVGVVLLRKAGTNRLHIAGLIAVIVGVSLLLLIILDLLETRGGIGIPERGIGIPERCPWLGKWPKCFP